MRLPVSGEEGDLHSVDPSDEYLIGRLSVGGVRENGVDEFEPVRVVDSRSAYDSDSWHDGIIAILIIKRDSHARV